MSLQAADKKLQTWLNAGQWLAAAGQDADGTLPSTIMDQHCLQGPAYSSGLTSTPPKRCPCEHIGTSMQDASCLSVRGSAEIRWTEAGACCLNRMRVAGVSRQGECVRVSHCAELGDWVDGPDIGILE